MIDITSREKEMIIIGLGMRRNYIETGNPIVSAVDAKRFERDNVKVNVLSTSQMQLIIDTEALITKLYQPDQY